MCSCRSSYSVRLNAALNETEAATVALRAAGELDVSILKLTHLLESGPGLLTKPVAEDAAARVAEALRRAGAEVEVVSVAWEARASFEEAAQGRAPSQDILASGEWPPLVLREEAAPSAPPRRATAARMRRATPLFLALLAGVAFLLLPDARTPAAPAQAVGALRPQPSFAAGQAAFEARDYGLALAQWQPLAEAGDAEAQYGLAQLYGNGLGVERDVERAAAWYTRAAEQEDAKAQYELGWLYANGLGLERDMAAADWYERAALQGYPEAQVQLGLYHLYGEQAQDDEVAAAKWFQAAAEQGVAEAQYRLGVLYLEGQGVTKDLALAERWLRLANRQGVEEAKPFLAALEDAKVAAAAAQAGVHSDFPDDARTASAEDAPSALGDAVVTLATPEPLVLTTTPLVAAAAPPPAPLETPQTQVPAILSAATIEPAALPNDPFVLAAKGSDLAIRAALAAGLEVGARDSDGQTVLMHAARANGPEVLSTLLAAGAEVNAQDEAGRTALMLAAQHNPAVIDVLLERGADALLINREGLLAAELLRRHHPEAVTHLTGAP